MPEIQEGLDIEHWPEFLALAERLMLTCTHRDRSIKILISEIVEISHSYTGVGLTETQEEETPDRSLYGKFE